MKPDPDGPVAVATADSEIEAGVLVSALEAEGIEARMVGEFVSGFRAEAPGQVSILVRRADVERAREILEQSEPDKDE